MRDAEGEIITRKVSIGLVMGMYLVFKLEARTKKLGEPPVTN